MSDTRRADSRMRPDDGAHSHRKKRAPRRDTALWAAIGVSVFLHLSTVTLFSIGIWFPKDERVFHDFVLDFQGSVVGGDVALPTRPGTSESTLTVPSLSGRFAGLPSIAVPKVERVEIGQLSLRRAEMDSLRKVEALSDAGASWTKVESGVGRLRSRLESWNPFGGVPESEDEGDEDEGLVALPEPAIGFEMYIDWLTGDSERAALYGDRFSALIGISDSDLLTPLSFLVEVDPFGGVVNVVPPSAIDEPFVAALVEEIGRYSFEPLAVESNQRNQHGTLVIRRSEAAP